MTVAPSVTTGPWSRVTAWFLIWGWRPWALSAMLEQAGMTASGRLRRQPSIPVLGRLLFRCASSPAFAPTCGALLRSPLPTRSSGAWMRLCLLFLILFASTLRGQQCADTHHERASQSPRMMGNSMNVESRSLIESIEDHTSAGTDVVPNSTPVNMLMFHRGGWMLMLHGVVFLTDTQQTGPRGRDKLFAPNWVMPM